MKAMLPSAMAIFGLLAGATILPPPARADTVNVTYEYVYFAAGKHQRQPRTISGSGFAPISSQPGGQETTGLQFIPGQPPASQQVGAQLYNFAFMTVTGGSATSNGPPGGVTSTDPTHPPTSYVEKQPIVVLTVYVPAGGGVGPGSGATIDAFNETTGTLFNDSFVSVAPDDQQSTLTTSGNVWGYVDTTKSAEVITALSPTLPTDVDFSRWVLLVPSSATAAKAALSVPQGGSPSALAFYRANRRRSRRSVPRRIRDYSKSLTTAVRHCPLRCIRALSSRCKCASPKIT